MRLPAIFALALIVLLSESEAKATAFRYFYDDANELYRALDSTGTLIEYTYDAAGNIVNVSRTTALPSQLFIFNVTPSNTIGGNTITILGQNFSTLATGDIVMIGGVAATVVSATSTQLVVTVPNTGSGGAVSVTVNGVTATWSNTISVMQAPYITGVSPASGKSGATVSVTVTGQNLYGATFALVSVDPVDTNPGATITVGANSGTTATLNLTLGTTQGQFAIVGTNSVGTGTITPGSIFLIGPVSNAAAFYLSVLNTSFDPSANPPLPAGQNTVVSYASVLNTAYNPITNPAFPPGQNSLTFYASVLNTSYDPSTNPPLPAGQNTAAFYASVLNTAYNPILNPPFPPGQNSTSFYASVLNTAFNAAYPALPAGQNTVSYFVSVCNTSFGCTATSPTVISASAAAGTLRPRPPAPQQGPPSRGLLPLLESLENVTSVTTGQTIRLAARNVDPGSTVEFNVNRVPVATIHEPPYETLFTVPDGPSELVFQLAVRAADHTEGLSALTRMTVVPDAGAEISGHATESGSELSLSAGGLKAEFFHLAQPVVARPSLDQLQPLRSDYVTAVNELNPGAAFGDDPLGAHLRSDYAVRFSGEVRADVSGQYRFWLTARSGAALLIDGKLLADSGLATGEPAETAVSIALDRGWHWIEVIHYLAVGPASVRLEWQRPGSARRETVGPEYLRTVLADMTAATAADGAFAFTGVPRKFDSVWIRVKRDNGVIEFPAVKPGDSAVLIAVPK